MNIWNSAGSSNGRTTPFGGVCRGSNPLPAANNNFRIFSTGENN
jgi:hypothetical protein